MTEIVRIPVGTGTPEGINNAYLLPEAGVIVDPGPPTDEAWTALREGITAAGATASDIDHVLVTHWHMDHAGLACRFADEAEATVSLHADDAGLVGDYATAREQRVERDSSALSRWGAPQTVREVLREADDPSPVPDAYDVRGCADGDTVAGVEFVHTPGHTKGHTSFVYDGTLLLGDLLLPTYTPNVGGSDTRMRDPLAAYLRSIDRVNGQFDSGEPGHGTTIDVAASVTELRAHHRDRAMAVFDALDAAGGDTPWDVALALFGEMDGIHAKFGAGEAAAHLQRLDELCVVERCGDDPVRYSPLPEEYPTGLNLTP